MSRILLLVAIFFISYCSYGQLGLGIKGAVTMSTLSVDVEDIEEAAKVGWQLGAFARIGDKLHLQPEAYITAKPGQIKYKMGGPDNVEITQKITFNTIDIPVLVGYKIIDPPTLNIRLQAGPVASIVTNKKFEVSGEGITPTEPDDEYKDSFKDMNWGFQVGAGVDFLFLTADIRYEIGLNNIYKKAENMADEAPGEFKNNVFFLTVGWKFL